MEERIELLVPFFYRCDEDEGGGIELICRAISSNGEKVTLKKCDAHFSPGEYELGEKDERKMKLDLAAYNREMKRLKRINKLERGTAIEADALKWITPAH